MRFRGVRFPLEIRTGNVVNREVRGVVKDGGYDHPIRSIRIWVNIEVLRKNGILAIGDAVFA